jgi:glucosyl-dolichyl phosphate glucuronosyltransferase
MENRRGRFAMTLPGPMKAKVSILICTRDRAANLARTLESLAQTVVPPGFEAEVIVVDNGSSDETPQVVRQCGIRNMHVRYLVEAQPGKCRACNDGIKAFAGDVLLFIDDDVLVPRDWISPMCAPILEDRADAVSGAVKIPDYLTRPWMTEYHRGWLASTENFNEDVVENMVGSNMACSRKVFQLVPEWDTELGVGMLGYHEESLFTWQLKLAGFRVRYQPNVAVEHHFQVSRLSRESMLELAIRTGRSSGYVAHHWEHRTIRHPRLRWFRARLRLAYWRLRRFGFRLPSEGAPRWEMEMVMDLAYYHQYAREKSHPRNYALLGLRRCAP